MYKQIIFIPVLCLLLPVMAFSQSSNWLSTINLNVSVNNSDRIDLYTDVSGNHIIVQKSNQLVYYLFSSAGMLIRSSVRDNNVNESPRLSRIVGWEGNLYIIYKEGNKIKTQKSTDGGASWSTTAVDEITMNNSTSNGIDAWTDANGVHLAYSEYDNSNGVYKTWYQRNDGNGSNWIEQKDVTDLSGDAGGFPSVTTSANRVRVAFTDGDDQEPRLNQGLETKSRDRVNGSWQSSQDIAPSPNNYFELNAIIATSNTLHGFYYDGTYFIQSLYYKSRSLSGTWPGSATFLNYADPNQKIDMGVTANDQLHIVYNGFDAAYREWNGSWSGEFVFAGDVRNPQLAANSNDIYVLWIDDNINTLKLRQRDFAPLAPQNLTASAAGTYQPVVLNWSANGEADLSQYKIYRAFNYSPTPPTSGYDLIATLNAYSGGNPVTSYTDWESFAYPSSMWLHYKIKARDSGGNESAYSNVASYNAVLKIAAGEEEETVIAEYSLEQNYPNPFNPTTTIAFALPETAPVRLQVFDLTGKLVKELVNQELAAGKYQTSFDASQLGSGIYVYRLQAGDVTKFRKMMLIK